jgi:PAS domain S-box-containing protein
VRLDLEHPMKRIHSALLNVFLLAAALLIGSFGLMYAVGQHALASHRRIETQRAVLQHLARSLSTLEEAEAGQRGFLLTGDPAYIVPYRKALDQVRPEQAALQRLADEGNLPATTMTQLLNEFDQRLAALEQALQARQNAGLDAALAIVRTGRGEATMARIRAEVQQLKAAEDLKLGQELQAASRAVIYRTSTYVSMGLSYLGFLFWAYHRITREIQAREAAVLESSRKNQLLATTLTSIGDGVIATDAQGKITFLNAEAERLTGWSSAEAAGRSLPSVFRIINEETHRECENPVEKVLRLGTVVGLANHTLLVRKNGTEVPIDDSAAPIRQPDGQLFGVVLVFRDCSVPRKAEETRAHLAAIVQFSSDAIFTEDLKGMIQSWNEGAERLFGYRAEEIIGQPITLLLPPDRQDEDKELLARITSGEPCEWVETIRVAKDGRRIPVALSISRIEDREGRVIGASKIIHDITEQKRAQAALLESEARFRQQLEEIVEDRTARLREMVNELQHVSYAMVHDMRAPLRAMQAFAQLLLKPAEAESELEREEFLERIMIAANRLDKLVQDALNYNRTVLEELPMHPVDLAPLLNDLLRTYPNLDSRLADIRIEGSLPEVLGNESLLTQCFANLLGNAVKFVAEGVRPSVRIWAQATPADAPQPAAFNPSPLVAGLERGSIQVPALRSSNDDTPRVRVWVEDNGIGIPKHAQRRLFGMFQKLDNKYDGTGIGLAIVRKVAERMGGRVGAESEPGSGSRFWVELRLANGVRVGDYPIKDTDPAK